MKSAKLFCFLSQLCLSTAARLAVRDTSPVVGGYFSNKNVDLRRESHLLPRDDLDTLAQAHLAEVTSLDRNQFQITDAHTSDDTAVRHVYFKESHNGIEIVNGVFNVNIYKDGSIISHGLNFEYSAHIDAPSPDTNDLSSSQMASASLLRKLNVQSTAPPKTKLVYYRHQSTLKLAWEVRIEVELKEVVAYVDAAHPKMIYRIDDFISDASYRVYPFAEIENPSYGERKLENDNDRINHPIPWTNMIPLNKTETLGNNAAAQYVHGIDRFAETSDVLRFPKQQVGPDGNFDFPLDLAADPLESINASVTQAFYTANMYHDLFLQFGFTEAAGNFQDINDSGEGLGNDSIVISVQEADLGSSFFYNRPDGESPSLVLAVFNTTYIADDAFDRGILIHELSHGLSMRIVGGPAADLCIISGLGGGMGEGWSDFFAAAVYVSTATDRDSTTYVFGAYSGGIH